MSGTTYAFKTRAVNEKGNSEYSEELIIAVAAPVAKPAAPVRNLALSARDLVSNKTTLRIEWAQSSQTQIEVQGYQLYMSEGTAGNFAVIFNGSMNSLVRHYDVANLTIGQLY